MTNRARCPRCRRSTVDGLLCGGCVTEFEAHLVRLASWLPEVDVTVAGLDQLAPVPRAARAAVGLEAGVPVAASWLPARLRSLKDYGALAEMPLPLNIDAAEVAGEVRRRLAAVVRVVRGDLDPAAGPGEGLVALVPTEPPRARGDVRRPQWWPRLNPTVREPSPVAWLLRNMATVRRHEQARGLVGEVEAIVRRVERLIDSREPELYFGPCDETVLGMDVDDAGGLVPARRVCGTELYTSVAAPVVTCPGCGAMHHTAGRQDWLLEQARGVWARPAVIAAALRAYGRHVTANRIDLWISRDRRRFGHVLLEPAGCRVWAFPFPVVLAAGSEFPDGSGRPVYRVGDVLDRLEWVRGQDSTRESCPTDVDTGED